MKRILKCKNLNHEDISLIIEGADKVQVLEIDAVQNLIDKFVLKSNEGMIRTLPGGGMDTAIMIPIEADPRFPLAGKIIGPKGAYIKDIIEETGAKGKIRLRGMGSGYTEGFGVNTAEAKIPMQL